MNKTKGKLIFAVVSLVIALTLATSTTFAWFTTNSRVSTGNVNMTIAVNGDLFLTTSGAGFNTFTGTADVGQNPVWGTTAALADYTNKLAPITIKDINANPIEDANGNIPEEVEFTTVAGNVVNPSGGSSADLTEEIGKAYYTQTIRFAATSVYDIFLGAANFSVTPNQESKKSSKYPHDLLTFPATDNAAAVAIAIKDVVYTAPTEGVSPASLAISGTANGVAFTNDATTTDGSLTVAEDGTVSAAFTVSEKTFTITYTVADNTYALFSDVTGCAIHEKGTTVTDKNADYAMRVAFLISVFNTNTGNPDEVVIDGNTVPAKQLVIYDPNTGMGWSAYGEYDDDGNCTGYNLAHEIYDATMRVPLTGDEKKVVQKPVDSVTMLGDATNNKAPKKLARLVYQVNSDSSTAENIIRVYGAEITMYVWLEGTDADCIDAIAGYNLNYSLEFVGELVPPSPTTNP